MIVNPIIPVWLMAIICLILIIYILNNKKLKSIVSNKKENEKTIRQRKLVKRHVVDSTIKILIVITLFVINLRFMIPNGEGIAIENDLDVLFVLDKSISMRALDYNGGKERLEGVINDCCHIVDELSGAKYSIITFGDEARKIVPFTTDSDMIQAELKALTLENDSYAKGTSINVVKDTLEETLKKEKEKIGNSRKIIVFFVTDGEITVEGEKLHSFSNMSQYISSGAVMGYGTETGGKMISDTFKDNPSSEYYYLYYYENFKKVDALSKIDENNLRQMAGDLGIDYLRMDQQKNINNKLKEIKQDSTDANSGENKINTNKDIYYYFAIPLLILLIADFIVKKRRM